MALSTGVPSGSGIDVQRTVCVLPYFTYASNSGTWQSSLRFRLLGGVRSIDVKNVFGISRVNVRWMGILERRTGRNSDHVRTGEAG